MIISADAIILDFRGNPIPSGPGEPILENGLPVMGPDNKPMFRQPKPLTVSDACIAALIHMFPNEEISADEKVRRFKLGNRLSRGGDITLSAEEIVCIKNVVGRFWNALIVGRIYEILDPEPVE